MNEIKESITLKFQGSDEINVRTLSKSLLYLCDIIEQIDDNVNYYNKSKQIVVANVKKGSFIVDLIISFSDLIENVASVVTILEGILLVKKHFKGKQPKKIEKNNEKTTITNYNGEKLTVNNIVINIYSKDDRIEKELSELSDSLAEDINRKDLEIDLEDFKGNKKKISYNEEELKVTSTKIDVENAFYNEKELHTEKWLKIKKIDLLGDSQWEFREIEGSKEGKIINAKVIDKDFVYKLKSSELIIKAGMSVLAKVLIKVKMNLDGECINDRTIYIIEEVIRVKYDEEEVNLKFDI